MTLTVHTARISSRDPDRFDVTRKSGSADGLAFAPSWAILNPALDLRRVVDAFAQRSDDASALRIEDAMWALYAPAYLAEMRASYRRDRGPWLRLLACERVVLVCYCANATHCHRTLLARDILPTLGAAYAGEIA